ncbi:hypothetical protein VT84_09615 [Gemmata sp. SH-PL17]|uniref:hypothetical protein n=1 Tax=Gemmata sp. SH-PL17 TaxID=1630693 RepID=UPI00078B73C9|nr:hypothetical protein [Gemmata sp. SH-PL17]AMV24642.1 hypothetical protein VT84_09615 [Gemmata sp. SH-PL17]
MSAKKDANNPEPQRAFYVAVVGAPDLIAPRELGALLDRLLTRHQGGNRIVLLVTSDGPEVQLTSGQNWPIHLVPLCSGVVKRDCEIIFQSHAIVVIGDPGPWARLLKLADEARIPTRVYRDPPRVRLSKWPDL